MKPTLIFFLLGISSSLFSNSTFSYFEIVAGDGAGVYSLLRNYELDKDHCNHKQFYALNRLKPKEGLLKGKTYKLPLLEFKYNGKSIRSTIDSSDLNFAVRIKSYNEKLVKKGVKKLLYTKDQRLLIPYHMLYCEKSGPNPTLVTSSEEKAPNKSFKIFELFGDKYAKTEIVDNSLEGKVFFIMAGHGGPDPGSMGKASRNTLCEDEYAYDVSLRLTRELVAHGAIAYMINRDENDGIRAGKFLECDYDEKLLGDIKMSRNQRIRLGQRAAVVNRLYDKHQRQGVKSQTLISIHIDSRKQHQKADVFFYHHLKSVRGNLLADRMMDVFNQKYKMYQSSRGYHGKVQGRNLHILRESKPLAVFVELGNIQNPFDQKRFLLEDNRQLLALWLYEGLITAP